MASQRIRIVHYLNQFFGGIGGEDKADVRLRIKEGPVGPGIGLQGALGDKGRIIATLVCGDNYFSAETNEVRTAVLEAVRKYRPDVMVAGPAFNAGRYGFACGELSKAVVEGVGIPAVTALYPENPAVEIYRRVRGLWILPTGLRAAEMPTVLPKLGAFALRVASGASIGPAREEGYLPTGKRNLELAGRPGAERGLAMLLEKLAGQPFQSEIPKEPFEKIPPAAALDNLPRARLAVITTSGLVPKGNPDRFTMFNASSWSKYPLPKEPAFRGEDWEVIHGGFNTVYAQMNPNLVLPLDVLRELAGRAYGELHDYFYSITGVGTSLTVAKRAGEEIASSMRESQIDAVLLVAT